jgi:hypothetical protein
VAAGVKANANPDLAKGERIPAGATRAWNPGATGDEAVMLHGGLQVLWQKQLADVATE